MLSSRALVLEHTVEAAPYLVPELQLRLLPPTSPLWSSPESVAAASGLVAAYWAFAWPGGQALARHLLDHPELVRGLRVLDFGAGGAVEGVAAMKAGAASCLCADIDPLAAEAAQLNAAMNGVTLSITTDDVIGRDGPWDVVLAGDACYERALADRVFPWFDRLSARGAVVLLGDPGRLPLPEDRLQRLADYAAPHDGDPRGTTLWATVVSRWR